MRIAVGTDHGGFLIKQTVVDTLQELGHEVVDVGAYSLDPKDDYPDFAIAVGRAVQSGEAERGIAICGSGVGVVIAANKLKGVRACLCHDTYSAAQGVQHDNMNVLGLGGRIVGPALVRELVIAFVNARFARAERFQRRMDKVKALEG
jgi:ribose 5-phosphate isomerase B